MLLCIFIYKGYYGYLYKGYCVYLDKSYFVYLDIVVYLVKFVYFGRQMDHCRASTSQLTSEFIFIFLVRVAELNIQVCG